MFMRSDQYQNKKVLIFGLGLNQGGVGAAKFFLRQGSIVKVTDLKTEEQLKLSIQELDAVAAEVEAAENLSLVLGEHREKDIEWADLIIRNPGVKPDNKFIQYALSIGKRVETDLGIFIEYIKYDQIIGVTGTKGKSTTASLIYHILRKTLGERVSFSGNIGKSVLDIVPFIKNDSIIVLELSSFQLLAFEQHKYSPKYAVITNIYPDHLNYHADMEDYINAKRNICKFQSKGDFLLLRKNDPVLNSKQFREGLKGEIIYYSSEDLGKIDLNIVGDHNLENLSAAVNLAKIFGIKKEDALESARDFKGPEFRMELIKNLNNVKIYNDSASTNPKSTIKALEALPDCLLIAGGMDKGLSYEELAETIDRMPRKVIFIDGTATDEILKFMKKKEKVLGVFDNFESIFKIVFKSLKEEGDTILFSPGGTSFNFFQNEFDRGRKFNAALEKFLAENSIS